MGALLTGALLMAAQYPSLPEKTANEPEHCVASARGPSLEVDIQGLKNRQGELRVELYPDHDPDFLSDKDKLIAEGKTFRRVIFNVPQTGHAVGCLPVPAPGRYSVAIIHDTGSDRKFNFRRDGIAFPGNPRLGWGRPPANKAWVTVGREGVTRISVTLQYYDGFLGMGPVRRPVDDQ